MSRQCFDDLVGETTIDLAVVATMPARLIIGRLAGFKDMQNLGILVGQPFRRRGGGRSENSGDTFASEGIDRSVEKAKIIVALAGFHYGPSEFTHPYYVHATLLHAACVLFPFTLWPLLGVIAHAEKESVVSARNLGCSTV